jgi:hypothetical protein
VLIWLLTASAFTEDLCPTSTVWEDCYRQTCPALDTSAPCVAEAVQDAARAASSDGRSMLHVDATYLLAQAAGFDAEDAHVIAAYDQATDQGVYIPRDRIGAPLVDVSLCDGSANQPYECRWSTIDVNGWERTSLTTGGFQTHLPAPVNMAGGPVAIDGLHPDLEDHEHEVLLSSVWRWVQDLNPYACTLGLTQGGPDLASGPRCWLRPDGNPKWITADFPTLNGEVPIRFPLGEQVLRIENNTRIYSSELDDPLARMGIFLHLLQDRISHHVCGDASWMGPERANPGRVVFRYSDTECSQINHALRHSWEIGREEMTLASDPRHATVRPALEATWAALLDFGVMMGVSPVADGELLIDELVVHLGWNEPWPRLDGFEAVTLDWGLVWLPGHNNGLQ